MSDLDVPIVRLKLVSDDGFIRIAIKAAEEEEEEESEEDKGDSLETEDKSSIWDLSPTEEQSKMLLLRIRTRITRFVSRRQQMLKDIFLLVLFVAYMIYYGFAMAYSVSSATALTVFTSIGLFAIAYNWVSDHYRSQINRIICHPLKPLLQRHWNWMRWLLCTVVLTASTVYLFLCVIQSLRQVRCLFGAILFLLLAYLTSKQPDKIRWWLVGLGLYAQFVIGVFVLRWSTGFTVVNSIFREIARLLLYYPMAGASAVYGDPFFLLHPIAMFVTSIFIYMGCVIAVVYNLTRAIRLLRYMKRWMPHMTDSQMHFCLVSTHAIFSGFALIFMSLAGVNIHHMVTGMILCLPAATAFSLVNFPETQKSTFSRKAQAIKDARPRLATNIYRAAFKGSVVTAKVVGMVYANILAFASIYALLDNVYSWLASRVGVNTNIMGTLGYAFMPIVYLMGVRWEECYVVGCLVADKVFGMVLRAFRDLGYMISLNELQADTAVIATHAVLGFSLLGTLGTWLGMFGVVAPRHRPRMMSIFPRVFLNANLVCFYSTSVAFVLSPESEYEEPGTMTGTQLFILWFLKSLPSYRDLMGLANQ